jgi:hypothetical protein
VNVALRHRVQIPESSFRLFSGIVLAGSEEKGYFD